MCAFAASELAGTAPGGSAYRIAVPDGWQSGDGLVLVQHGFRFQLDTAPVLGDSAQKMLDDGYAIAAPGYRQRGWAVFDAVADNAEILQIFRRDVGEPGTVLAHGGSMGALIALQLAEAPSTRDEIDGVLALCPAADGLGFWDLVFDLRIAYDALCADVPGGALPAGDAPFPWASNLDVLERAPTDPVSYGPTMREEPAVRACLGLELHPVARDSDMRARLSALTAIAGTDDEAQLSALLAYTLFGLADLVRAPDKMGGTNPFHNEVFEHLEGIARLRYATAPGPGQVPVELDAQVRREQADRHARLRLARAGAPEGTAGTRILAVNTSRDGIAPPQSLEFLTRRMQNADLGTAIVAELSGTHCGYNQAEYDAAWSGLRAWVETPGSNPPDATALTLICEADASNGACRFDASLTANVLSGELPSQRLRAPLDEPWTQTLRVPTSTTLAPGLWNDPARPAQGIYIEVLDDLVGQWKTGEQRIALAWYTWAPATDPQPGPRWLYGIGRVLNDAIYVDSVLEVIGGRFGSAFDITELHNEPWGRIEIARSPTGEQAATLRYEGPPGWGSGQLNLGLLFASGLNWVDCAPLCLDPPPPRRDYSRIGTYYDLARPAGGWVLSQGWNGNYSSSGASSLLVWFTWDLEGRPTWLFGIDESDADGLQLDLRQPLSGGRFEPGYSDEDVQFAEWGEVELRSSSCAARSLDSIGWSTQQPQFESDDVDVARLTNPFQTFAGAPCR